MNAKKYQKEATRTFAYSKKSLNSSMLNLLHCAIGASTEAGELLDTFKKTIYYGKVLDVVNIKEEIGDQLWYLSNLCELLGFDIEDVMETNIKKLKARYPEKFTKQLALKRNLEAEKIVLSSNNGKIKTEWKP
jgi:NTP pyrophosphatase (non-canonical NTP hydrolase)